MNEIYEYFRPSEARFHILLKALRASARCDDQRRPKIGRRDARRRAGADFEKNLDTLMNCDKSNDEKWTINIFCLVQ